MTNIEYRVGDLLEILPSKSSDNNLIVVAHIVNNVGAFGKGFAGGIAEKFSYATNRYRECWRAYDLGDNQYIWTPPIIDKTYNDVIICNMFAQEGLPSQNNRHPLRLDALVSCLVELAKYCREAEDDAEIQVWMPRIGTGYGGGSWDLIEPMIRGTLCASGIKTVVFDLPKTES